MLSISQLTRLSPTGKDLGANTAPQLPMLKPVLVNLFQFLLILFVIGGYHGGFVGLNSLGSMLPDFVWASLTMLGDTRLALVLLLVFVFHHPKLLTKIVLASFSTTLIVQSIKPWLNMPRPAAVLSEPDIHVIGEVLTQGSFPSGHSATIAVAITLLLTLVRSRQLARWLIFGMFVVGFSRTMVGAHWPVDVLSGILIGCCCALLAHWLTEHHVGVLWPPLQWLAIALILIPGLTIFVDDGGYPSGQLVAILLTLAALFRYLSQLAMSLPDQIRSLNNERTDAVISE